MQILLGRKADMGSDADAHGLRTHEGSRRGHVKILKRLSLSLSAEL